MYRRVESMGERLAEAYFAIARAAATLGDMEEEARALDAMLKLAGGGSSEVTPEQVDALYHLSEVLVGTEGRHEQGIDLPNRLGLVPNWNPIRRRGHAYVGVRPEPFADLRKLGKGNLLVALRLQGRKLKKRL